MLASCTHSGLAVFITHSLRSCFNISTSQCSRNAPCNTIGPFSQRWSLSDAPKYSGPIQAHTWRRTLWGPSRSDETASACRAKHITVHSVETHNKEPPNRSNSYVMRHNLGRINYFYFLNKTKNICEAPGVLRQNQEVKIRKATYDKIQKVLKVSKSTFQIIVFKSFKTFTFVSHLEHTIQNTVLSNTCSIIPAMQQALKQSFCDVITEETIPYASRNNTQYMNCIW